MKKFIFTLAIVVILISSGVIVYTSKVLSSQASTFNKSSSNNTLRTGLMGWWTMDGADVNATQVLDKSGHYATGTITAVTMTSGKIGQAGSWKAANSVVTLGSEFVGAGARTGCAWIFPNGYGANNVGRILDNSKYTLGYTSTDAVWVILNGSGAVFSAAGSVKLNKWTHVCATNDASGVVNFYVNGFASGLPNQSTASPVAGTLNLQIGNINSIQNFNGKIDDVRIYSRVLSAIEIKTLYNQGNGQQNVSNPINLKDGLVGWWTFDGADVTANTTTDRSVSGANGTRTLVRPSNAKIGQGMYFNGLSSYVTVANPALDDFGTGDMTVSAWIKTSNTASSDILDNKTSGSNSAGFTMELTATGLVQMRLANGTTQASSNSTVAVNNGKWHYIVGVRNATGHYIYIDGVRNGTVQTGSSGWNISSSQPLMIGTYTVGGGAQMFLGTIDDVRIYNRALSPAEIMQLYRMGK